MENLGPPVGTFYDIGPVQAKFVAVTTHETMFAMAHGRDGYGRGEWKPRLVKSFDASPDGLTWTMNRQEGVRWYTNFGDWGHFNADDLIWSIGDLARIGSAHPQAANVRQVNTCDGRVLTKVDDYTVELKRPAPTFKLTWHSQSPLPSFSVHSLKHYEAVGLEGAIHEGVGHWSLASGGVPHRRLP